MGEKLDMEIYKRDVDIIIPVYNALEDLKLCVESIKRNTNLKKHRLILINDKSSDEKVWSYMQSIETDNILIFNNEVNLGFSGNINRGIQISNRDVILLNSDTIVTQNWIEKIVNCAYSDPAIGTVTPLSNNATLCSVPEFCEENKLPKGYTIDKYAELIEKCSMKKYPHIPVAHGFCMYIKREVIDKVGLFDAETFGRGYGEENDFCHRAGQIGYIHVMCDDTYIYHSGTSSFQSEEKLRYIEAHDRIIYQRYQKQTTATRIYCNQNPNREIADNIKLYTELNNGRKNILYILHSDFKEGALDNVGGVQLHVKDLTTTLKDTYNVFVMARSGNILNLTAYVGKKKFEFYFQIGNVPDYPIIRNRDFNKLYNTILSTFNINMVHVHHVTGLSFEIFYVAQELNIPVITTIHDYYYICPNVKLLNSVDSCCCGKDNIEMCKACLRKRLDISETTHFIENWRVECKKALEMSQLLITPSENAKTNMLRYYPELEDKIQVIPHGSETNIDREIKIPTKVTVSDDVVLFMDRGKTTTDGDLWVRGWAYNSTWDNSKTDILIEISNKGKTLYTLKSIKEKRFDVANGNPAFLDSGFQCLIPKEAFSNVQEIDVRIILRLGKKYFTNGSIYHMLAKDFSLSQKKNTFNVAFIGGLSIEKGAQFAYDIIKGNTSKDIKYYIFGAIGYHPLINLKKENLKKTGAYHRDELATLIRQYHIDLICILPISRETFCYTLSEAILAGVPVIVTDMGALPERIEEMNCGIVVSTKTKAKEISEKISELAHDPLRYNQLLKNVQNVKLRTITEMCLDYDKLYQKLTLDLHLEKNTKNLKYICKHMGELKQHTTDTNTVLRLQQTEAELNAIKNATTYKFMKSLDHVKIPFRRQIKQIIKKTIKN